MKSQIKKYITNIFSNYECSERIEIQYFKIQENAFELDTEQERHLYYDFGF
jgi:hypothetical protein